MSFIVTIVICYYIESARHIPEETLCQYIQIHQKIVNLRQDYFFKLAHKLTNNYDYIFLEDLNMKGMQRMWGRKVADLSHAGFVNILQHVAQLKGTKVFFINRYYPSSKTFHVCQAINHNLDLSMRSWTCACGVTHDRDENAAVNILMEGASSIGPGDVRPANTEAVSA